MSKVLSLLCRRKGLLLWTLCTVACPGNGVTQLDDCTGTVSTIGDGVCDSANNLPACQYDGGDCCTSTAQFEREFVVEDSADAADLARSIICSDGEFSVDWRGEVTVADIIWVSNGTSLKVTGPVLSGTAIADGKGATQLFSVIGGSLDMSHLQLRNGFARRGGGVFVGEGGVATFTHTSFTDNTASERGGALFVDGAGSVSWTGDTSFIGNMAKNGGAIHVSGESSVSWGDGQTRFYNNKAAITTASSASSSNSDGDVPCFGGALSVDEGSSASWSSRTIFEQNKACECGGAVFGGDGSLISWEGETDIVHNTAPSGGGVYLRERSSLSWTSNTTLAHNIATELNGGAVFATGDSSISWDGYGTTIANNTAQEDGGGISLANGSNLVYTGYTKFISNTADDGGAFALGLNSEISYSGATLLENNRAYSDGGAVYASLIGDTGETRISMNGSTIFHNNSCGEYGGALMLGGSAFITFGSVPVTFEKNSAESSGGAVFLSGLGMGPTFTGVNFTDNKAHVGGAIYATGSGTTFTEDKGEEYATVYEGCTFARNEASATGGAMESAAGKDIVKDSTFSQNRAQEGGALRLAGIAKITKCSFEKNRAEEGSGPAVSTVGFPSQMANCTFSGNVFICGDGTFLDDSSDDRYAAVCDGCSPCGTCEVADTRAPSCSEALPHTSSTGGGVTLEELVISAGHWRATPSSRVILECFNHDACVKNETGVSGNCAVGYEGPYCAVCSSGYAESLAFRCSRCSRRREIIFAAVVIPIFGIFVTALIVFLVSKEQGHVARGQAQSRFERFREWVPLNSAKIVIVSWQILTSISDVGNVTFPDAYQSLLDWLEILNFDVGFALSSGGCFNIDFHGRLLAITLGPIIFTSLLGVTYKVAWYRNRLSSEALQKIRGKHSTVFLWMTFLVYSTASSIVFKTFSCESLEDGNTYLRADYRIKCTSDKHKMLKVYAGLMMIVYPLGIPLLYVAVLVWGRDAWKIAGVRSRNDAHVQAATVLSRPYRPGCFYYEVVECARRMLLTGAVVFIFPNDSAQLAITLVMACAFSLVYEALAPYRSKWDAWVARGGHLIVLLSVFVAFLLKVELNVDSEESNAFGGVLIVTNVLLVLAVLVEGTSLACTVSERSEAVMSRNVMNAAQGFAEPAVGFGNAAVGFFPSTTASRTNSNNAPQDLEHASDTRGTAW